MKDFITYLKDSKYSYSNNTVASYVISANDFKDKVKVKESDLT